MKVLGFAGTAKNTGKTTTASRVLSALRDAGARVAVTSIGYDGEDIDNVTGLPKPLYYLKAGDIIATAEQCLRPAKPGSWKLLEATDIQTILGEIQIVQILENNTYTLAGPNRRTDLDTVLNRLAQFRVDTTLIDGALNRIVPMICANGLILSTGAAFDEDIRQIAVHAACIADLFTYKKVENGEKHRNIHLQMENGETVSIRSTSLISLDICEKIQIHLGKKISRLTIPGACYPDLLKKLLNVTSGGNIIRELIFGNPLYLIASGNPLIWQETLTGYQSIGSKIRYMETLPLKLITVSPFFPRYVHNLHSYEAAYVDAGLLQKEIRSAVTGVPIVNVEEVTNQELLSLIS